MANQFSKLSFDELVEAADTGMRGNGPLAEANRRVARSSKRLTVAIAFFTFVILILNIVAVFPELGDSARGILGLPPFAL